MANNIEMDFIVKGYQDTHQKITSILDIKKKIDGEKTVLEFSTKGSEKALSDYQKLRQYQRDLKEEQKQFSQGSKEWEVVSQKIKDCGNSITKLERAVNNYGTEFDKATLQNIKNLEKLDKTQQRIANSNNNKKQFENQQKEAESLLRTWQDTYRKIEKAKNDMSDGKQLTPSEYSYLKETLRETEKQLNKMMSGVDKFSGKWNGATKEVKKLKKYIEDAMQFTKDNTIETNARDNLIKL